MKLLKGLIQLSGFISMGFILDSLGAGPLTWKYWAIMLCTILIALIEWRS